MTESILAIDPGEVTGWSLWAFDLDHPLQRLEYGMIHGGTEGFITFMELRLGRLRPDLVIVEDWNVNDGRNGDPTHPLQIKGALMAMGSALGLEILVQPNGMKALCSDEALKRHGFYIMPAQAKIDPAILHTDARDINDSQAHALAWAKASGHEPTVALFWPDE